MLKTPGETSSGQSASSFSGSRGDTGQVRVDSSSSSSGGSGNGRTTNMKLASFAVPLYRCRYSLPDAAKVLSAQRAQAAADADVKPNESGCARAESCDTLVTSETNQTRRVTRALLGDIQEGGGEDVSRSAASSSSLGKPKKAKRRALAKVATDESELKLDLSAEAMLSAYRQLKSVPLSLRVVVKRSHVHGWGLFVTNQPVKKHAMIVEYAGQTVGSCVADSREKQYELEGGPGSCYLFRLDKLEIVDATKQGCLARFINHCCQPNAYAKVIRPERDHKIVFFALRTIEVGEEIFYDYKFPIEEEKLPCKCGAPCCRRFLN
mmetsp:Transcript_49286/g.67193  ORF Transcript_49286/g.67193 Transcript_49286/m.67193 type:complete len:322 (-) Transcript_49286:139-1104(-)